MGTRINYEIMLEDGSGVAAILYSNSHHPTINPEAIFIEMAKEKPGPTSLVRSLLNIVYTAGGNHVVGSPVFWIDTCPGDREKVYRVSYVSDAPEITLAEPAEPVRPPQDQYLAGLRAGLDEASGVVPRDAKPGGKPETWR